MVPQSKRVGAHVLRLMVGFALLSCASVGSAQGTWSVISPPQQPGEVFPPRTLAVDAAGNLYVTESYADGSNRILNRDAQGNWSVIATNGFELGQVFYNSSGLAVGGAGDLYVADWYGNGRIQKRDIQGHWSLIATQGTAIGQVYLPYSLAADGAGNLYVADGADATSRIQRRDAQGNWSVIASYGDAVGQIYFSDYFFTAGLAVDSAGNLYVAGALWPYGNNRIQKRDVQGNWSLIATSGGHALAVDSAGNLYVAVNDYDLCAYVDDSRIQKRDAQGDWSLIATYGSALGQVDLSYGSYSSGGLAVDAVGNLYVADSGNKRVLMYTPQP